MQSVPFHKVLTISRPRFWIYYLGAVAVGAIAASEGIRDLASWDLLILGIYFTLPANLFLYGVNDIFDYETDIRNPKKQDYEGLIHPEERGYFWLMIALSNLPFVLYFLFSQNIYVNLMVLATLIIGFFYSAPPIRAKAKPILDASFMVHHVTAALSGYFLVTSELPSLAFVLAAWLWVFAMHAYSAVPDIAADEEAGLATVATLLRARPTIYLCLFCYLAAAALSFAFQAVFALLAGATYAFLMLLSVRRVDIMPIYKVFPLTNTLVGGVLWWVIAFSKGL